MIGDIPVYLVAGLVTGSLYGLAGMGLVLTYTTSGLFNFAHGAVAALGAFSFYSLREQAGLPWPVAALITLLVVAPVLGLLLERVAAGLAGARPAMKVVGTVGLLLLVVGALQLVYGTTQRDFPPFLPTASARVLGVNVSAEQAIDAAVAVAIATGLSVLLRRTQTGRAMRAVVADPALLSLPVKTPCAYGGPPGSSARSSRRCPASSSPRRWASTRCCSRCSSSVPSGPLLSVASAACRSPSPEACSSGSSRRSCATSRPAA